MTRSWHDTWIATIDDGLFADCSQLDSGSRLLRRGVGSEPEIEPSAATLRGEAWVSHVGVRPLEPESWNRLWGLVAGDVTLSASVVIGDLSIHLLDLAADHGIDLMPESGDVVVDCSCPDWHEPCKHVFALWLSLGRMIETDPWIFLLMRGLARSTVVDDVRSKRAAARGLELRGESDEPRGADPGADVLEAFRRTPGPPPPALIPVRRAGQSPATTPPPPADAGLEAESLVHLVADAASRAAALLNGTGDGGLRATLDVDVARIAGELLQAEVPLVALAERTGRPVGDLEVDGRAWMTAGAAGVAILRERFDAPPELLAEGAAALGSETRVGSNAVTRQGTQLRVDQDGLWFRFDAHDTLGWILGSRGFDDPAEALV